MIENLAGHEVLAHRCTTFHPRTYRLHRGTTAVAVTLINYDDERLLLGRTQEAEATVIDYFTYIDVLLRWTTAPTFPLHYASSVSYPFPYICIAMNM
jgi:hypothetical protein